MTNVSNSQTWIQVTNATLFMQREDPLAAPETIYNSV